MQVLELKMGALVFWSLETESRLALKRQPVAGGLRLHAQPESPDEVATGDAWLLYIDPVDLMIR